ncbi:hypothetical protein H7J06_17570 [Mycobacterium hodleri]|uniref:hypothetical protein n=1 Tax=Mycolicibacterium hodleri TaxID=49897 RepID=UPI0021F27F3B|nr:hypothetical protein [Mycolicibacterium hodleri]MCV7134798.1 hypothetical protein [Mycolicibacterium hodleri]
MSNQIELVTDGDGLAVIGDSADVERFLLDQGLSTAPSKELDVRRLSSFAGTSGTAVRVGSDVAANSGRWVKLTAESAQAVKQYGLMATKTPGVSHAMIGKPGEVKQWLQIAQAPTALLSGPMALSALSAMMQQQAMQQQMDQIVEYLQEINAKVDNILRNQKDAVLAKIIAVDLLIEEALTVRNQVGRVSEITWSKIQSSASVLVETQAYAIRQLDGIAGTLETQGNPGKIAKATKEAEPAVREWLAVLARCFHLQDGMAMLELDRVLDSAPQDLDSHRLGLAKARQKRLDLISNSTARLLTQMNETIRKANSKVLLNPRDAPAAVRSSKEIATDVVTFRDRFGIESGDATSDAKRWSQAASEVVDKALATGSNGATVAKDKATDLADSAKARAIDLTDAARDKTADLRDSVRTRLRRK